MSSINPPAINNDHEVSRSSSALTGLINWLEDDPALIAVVASPPPWVSSKEPVSPPYANSALRSSESLHRLLSTLTGPDVVADLPFEQRNFREWLIDPSLSNSSHPTKTQLFGNHIWSTRSVQKQWLIIQGVPLPGFADTVSPTSLKRNLENSPSTEQAHQDANPTSRAFTQTNSSLEVQTNMLELAPASQKDPVVRCFMSEPLSAHQSFVRDFDWASTPLGPMSTWNSQLIETVSLTLTGTDPASVFWGTEMTSIYNEAFISIAGQKHPAMMGDSPNRAFAEVWDQFFEPRIQQSRIDRKPFSEDGLCLLLERRGYPEETFMTFTFLPLLGYSGEVVGFYHTVTEATQQVLSKRRFSLLLSTSEVLSMAQNLKSFWNLLVGSFTAAEYDAPFAVVYSMSEQTPGDHALEVSLSGVQSPSEGSLADFCRLEGCIGYPPDHKALLNEFWLHGNDSVFAPHFRSAMKSRAPRILTLDDGSLPPCLVEDLQTRGYSNECNALAICPLRPTNHDAALGFLAIGLSSRRPCDEDYRSFVNLLVKNISSSLASVVLLEDEKKRGLNAAERAAYERAQLTIKLQERELENQLQEHKFMLMAHQVPVGIFDLTPFGEIKFCNQAWFDMTKQDPDDTSMMSWMSVIHDGDRPQVEKAWQTVSTNRQAVSFEGRLKTPWQADSGDADGPRLDSTWFLARMSPVLADNGAVANVIGSITDISFQKYGMAQQIQRVEEAIEAKRQQENFVDMTSHEMRNPLNAMLLCAEELSSNLQTMSATSTDMAATIQEALASSIESAETIIYCGRHQKRIIDDVLTLSKLDARLLQITPIEVQPVLMVQETLRLFESEVRAQGIDVQLELLESLQTLKVVNVLLDPSRVVQILVNFIANAIKFTKTEEIRQMLITVGASKDRPTNAELAAARIQLIPHGGLYQDPTTQESWGNGDPVYLQFVVRDTGPGISGDDMVKLFGRFAQAQPKTHAHYGGSGLGLFISQQLAELQGGRVGIASEPGVGSSFYFYVKSRHAIVDHSATTQQVIEMANKPRQSSTAKLRKTLSADQKSPNTNATSVLVVEDNLVNQKVLKRQLQKLGYNVLVANHGEEALELIRLSNIWKGDGSTAVTNNNSSSTTTSKLHIILMDIEMPVMDGRECIQRIRKYENQGQLRQHIPVIALTANARPEQISGAKNFGFDEVISKPFQLPEVVRQMAKLLGQDSNQRVDP